jgi:hypothetical protein
MQAINAMKQHSGVVETKQKSNTPIDATGISCIDETFDKYNVRKIFGV